MNSLLFSLSAMRLQ